MHSFADGPIEDPVDAARRIHADDGMAVGLIYSQHLPVWQPLSESAITVATLEEEFRV